MPAIIETTVHNGELIDTTQEMIQERLDGFAEAHQHLKKIHVSVDLGNPDRPVVEIEVPIGEEALIGEATADSVLQAIEDALGSLRRQLVQRRKELKEKRQEQDPEDHDDDDVKKIVGIVAGILLVSVIGLNILRMSGCEADPYPTAWVSGVVTLDGQPLEDGRIYFRTESLGLIEGFPINDGRFKGYAVIGERRIDFSVIKQEKPPSLPLFDMPGVTKPETVPAETLPAQFNTQSTYSASVTEDGPNEFTFDLITPVKNDTEQTEQTEQ